MKNKITKTKSLASSFNKCDNFLMSLILYFWAAYIDFVDLLTNKKWTVICIRDVETKTINSIKNKNISSSSVALTKVPNAKPNNTEKLKKINAITIKQTPTETFVRV